MLSGPNKKGAKGDPVQWLNRNGKTRNNSEKIHFKSDNAPMPVPLIQECKSNKLSLGALRSGGGGLKIPIGLLGGGGTRRRKEDLIQPWCL